MTNARRVFACFEQPDLKADFSLTVDAPDSWAALSNSSSPEPVATREGVFAWPFTPTECISTYLVSIIAGFYASVKGDVYHLVGGHEIPLGIWARKSLVEYIDTDEVCEVTEQGFRFYETNYGFPHPFRKYDQIFCPECNAGAMEHPSNVTSVEPHAFRTKPTGALIDHRVITIPHKQARMWFDDLVMMKQWDDLQPNESFAEFMSHLVAVRNTRWKDTRVIFLASEKSGAIQQDLPPFTHPVAADVRDVEDVLINFNQITYGKDASVLKQLIAWAGLEEFLAEVRSCIAKCMQDNVMPVDLLAELKATSGRDLSRWMKVWLQEAGASVLSPEIVEKGDVAESFVIH